MLTSPQFRKKSKLNRDRKKFKVFRLMYNKLKSKFHKIKRRLPRTKVILKKMIKNKQKRKIKRF